MWPSDDDQRIGHLARIEKELVRIRNLIAGMLVLWVSVLLFPRLSVLLLYIAFFALVIYAILFLIEKRANQKADQVKRSEYVAPPPPPPQDNPES